ncbi:MAG TPA: phosphotransferase, partial [Myxococcaceae bacterium]|nr:phosphotransferase [Myxococcaceae bacterium]
TFLRTRHDELRHLIDRAESLGASLRDEPRPRALCHSDLHAGNVLVHPRGSIFIVDWDAPVLAPKERDLMFIGGGVGGVWNTSRESELFYRGYGAVSIDPVALAFYRFERIVEDVAVFGEQLLSAADGGDADQALQFFLNQFRPNDVVEIARASDVTHGINSRGGQV